MSLWARVRSDGVELLRDPASTAGLRVVEEDRPALGANQVHTGPTYEVLTTKVVVRWQVETRSAEDVNADSLRAKASQALDLNAAFLAIGSPTAGQTTTQVQRLTRETTALIRLLLGRLEDTTGT